MDQVVRLKRKGQITLPASVRERLALREGDLLRVTVEGRQVVLEPAVQGHAVAVPVGAGRFDAVVGTAALGGDAVADAARYDR
ncbi:MAG TPA: AbrB/MazE/SpoVT family DNA-binding domain-containing protein [bacterium]|nr:AbrB/MazE/SpoVT family DNA-binding domain-containing protein [bacterium]